MIQLPRKERYTIGLMTGSFYTDYSRMIADAICKNLAREAANTDIFLFQGLDATRYLEMREDAAKSFDRHYYSLFEYAKFTRPDLLIVSFGTISAVPKPMNLETFLSPFAGVPVIVIEDNTEIENGISITVDNYHGMYACVEHLIRDHGCRRILFVAGPEAVPDAAQRLAAYRDAMAANGLEVEENMIAYGDFTDHVDGLVDKLLAEVPNADAVCCANDEMAESAYRVLVPRGLYPGRDIAVTGFDDNGSARYMNPPLTTVRQDFHLVAESVAKAVDRLLHGEEAASEVIGAELIRRGSCGCLENVSRETKVQEGTDDSRVIEDRIIIKSLQNRNIISALLLRSLMTKDMTGERFFERLGDMLNGTGARQSVLFLIDEPLSVGEGGAYNLPGTLKLHLHQKGDKIEAYGFADAKTYDADGCAGVLSGEKGDGSQMAVFPLFCEDEQYGVLFVEIERSEMLFYYTLSLEIGTGLRYLRMELERRENHRILEEKNQILDFAASHDALTGCLNRAGVMNRAFSFIRDHADGDGFVVAMADVDYLKTINDTFGHAEGDIVIQMTASILSQALPNDAILGRTGGDEFICIFRRTNARIADEFMKAVRASCDSHNESGGKSYFLDISVGCYAFRTEEGKDLLSVFRKADDALYKAKRKRRDSVLK